MLDLIVRNKTLEAENIACFELISASGSPLPTFTPGAHIDVHLPNGLIRQYSLCHPYDEASNSYTIAVLKSNPSRGGSQAMHEIVQPGMGIQASIPRNLFELDETATQTLLFAGGIGITPLICMAQHLQRHGKQFELHYFCRSSQKAAFTEWLQTPALESSVHLYYDTDASGPVDTLLTQVQTGTHVYVCGPAGFMECVLDTASRKGWPSEQLHKEFFAPATDTGNASDHNFDVVLKSSGAVHRIPAGRTVFEVLDAVGVEIPVSCEQGICGTCVTGVLEGIPDHRDQFLTAQEKSANNCFTPCCSRAMSARLVLDL